MNKKKPIIGLIGLSAIAGGIYTFINKIYKGSTFLDSYVSKAEPIKVNSALELDDGIIKFYSLFN